MDLLSFVIFNSLQNQRTLALTWLDNAWLRLVAYGLGAVGLVLLGIEFVWRYREQQGQVRK